MTENIVCLLGGVKGGLFPLQEVLRVDIDSSTSRWGWQMVHYQVGRRPPASGTDVIDGDFY